MLKRAQRAEPDFSGTTWGLFGPVLLGEGVQESG